MVSSLQLLFGDSSYPFALLLDCRHRGDAQRLCAVQQRQVLQASVISAGNKHITDASLFHLECFVAITVHKRDGQERGVPPCAFVMRCSLFRGICLVPAT